MGGTYAKNKIYVENWVKNNIERKRAIDRKSINKANLYKRTALIFRNILLEQ